MTPTESTLVKYIRCSILYCLRKERCVPRIPRIPEFERPRMAKMDFFRNYFFTITIAWIWGEFALYLPWCSHYFSSASCFLTDHGEQVEGALHSLCTFRTNGANFVRRRRWNEAPGKAKVKVKGKGGAAGNADWKRNWVVQKSTNRNRRVYAITRVIHRRFPS